MFGAISAFSFQSTRPRGARLARVDGLVRYAEFQSTRPRGARPVARTLEIHTIGISIHAPARGATSYANIWDPKPIFQSTRPRGARLFISFFLLLYFFISIHAPARGATLCDEIGKDEHHISIHAPARGATRRSARDRRRGQISIHAPARGATCLAAAISRLLDKFQSTRPRGARPPSHPHSHPSSHFNPRAREGRDRDRVCALEIWVISIHAPARGAT